MASSQHSPFVASYRNDIFRKSVTKSYIFPFHLLSRLSENCTWGVMLQTKEVLSCLIVTNAMNEVCNRRVSFVLICLTGRTDRRCRYNRRCGKLATLIHTRHLTESAGVRHWNMQVGETSGPPASWSHRNCCWTYMHVLCASTWSSRPVAYLETDS